MKNENMKTIAYAGEASFLKTLTDQLDQLKGLKKTETGSRTDSDGHVISYSARLKKGGEPVELFWAMIGSGGKYLIRADKNLFEEVA